MAGFRQMRSIGRPDVPGRPHHPDIEPAQLYDVNLPGEPTHREIDAERRRVRAERIAKARELIHRGLSESLDVSQTIHNPLATGGPLTLVSYQVGGALVAAIEKIAVIYNNPQVNLTDTFGWRVMLNGGRVPNIYHNVDWVAAEDYSYATFSTLAEPQNIFPLWIQTGDVIEIQLFIRAAFDSFLTVTGRIGGHLVRLESG